MPGEFDIHLDSSSLDACSAHAGPEYGQTFTCRCTSGYAGESCEQQEAKNDFWMSVVECAAEIAEAAAVDGAAAAFAGQHVLPTSGH